MECRLLVRPWTVFEDPQQSPAAHGATMVSLYVCAAVSLLMGLFLEFALRKRPFAWAQDENGEFDDGIWDSDKLHQRFFILSTLGYGIAGLATQFYPGDMNWAIQIGKVVIILAWTTHLMTSCGALQKLCPESLNVLWLLGLVVVLAGLAEVVIPGDRHFQGFMWILAALALVCAFAWVLVQCHERPKRGQRRECGPSAVFRCQFCVFAAASYAWVAIAEPTCGYAGYAACYDACFMRRAPGGHFAFSIILLLPFYLSLPVTQGFHPYSYVFPGIPCWRGAQTEPESGSGPAPVIVFGKDDDANPAGPVP